VVGVGYLRLILPRQAGAELVQVQRVKGWNDARVGHSHLAPVGPRYARRYSRAQRNVRFGWRVQ